VFENQNGASQLKNNTFTFKQLKAFFAYSKFQSQGYR